MNLDLCIDRGCIFYLHPDFIINWHSSGVPKFQDMYFYIFTINLLQLTGHVMHQQFNIQQLYTLPTLYLCVLYLSANKQRLVSLIS